MSFFDKLIGRFAKSRKRTLSGRRLRVEVLERRQLMAGDLGTITGTIYTDLTDNGLTPDDTRLNNVTVRLFRDGGNGTFDNGLGDDVAAGTSTTNASGVYRFDDLTAGRYYVSQDAVAGLLQRTAETVKTIIFTEGDDANPATGTASGVSGTIVDTFDTFQTVTSNVVGTPGTSAVGAAEAIGGQRELFVNLTTAAGPADNVVLEANGGQLSFNTTNTGDGTRIITYDGLAESDAAVVDGTGLGSIDLTAGGNNLAFRLTVGNDDAGGTIIIRAYSSATNFSSITLPVPDTGGIVNATLFARFTDFVTTGGTGAVFTNINALEVLINSGPADGGIDIIETVARSVITSNAANLNPMSVGNLVFRDNNNDGLRAVAEPGIQGVTVELYNDANGDGDYDVVGDTLVDTETTDANGNYLFTNLLPGNYIAVIPASQFLVAGPLFSMVTSAGAAIDPDNDIDNDDNGSLVGAVVATGAITLVAGGEPTTDGDGVNSNLTLDLGFVPEIDTAIVKSGTASIDAGGRVTYTLTVTNNAPIAATNVVVTDNLPVGVTFVPNGTNGSTSSAAWTTQANPNAELVANIGTLAVGAQQVLTVVVNVDPALAASTINNIATVTSDGTDPTDDNEDDADTVITRNAVLTLTKTDAGRTTVSPGDTFTFTLVVTNTGLSTANNVTLIDVLPAGYSFVSFTAGSDGNPVRTVVGGLDQISASVASLAVGATMTVGVNVAVAAGITGTQITNTATADSDDSTPVNANDINNIVRNLNLSIDKQVSSATVGVGGQLTYTLAVTNNGPLDVTGVEVDDDLPAGFTLATTGNPGSVTSSPNATRDLLWTVGNLASGQTATVNIIVNVGTGVTPATGLRNTATIAVDRLVGFTDTVSTDNSDFVDVAVEPRFDLLITKDDTLTTVTTGQQYAYTITVNNNGPSAATNVVINDVLPTGLQFVSATSNAVAFGTNNGQNFSGTIASLASGETRTITLTVRVLPSATGANIANTVTVTADNAATRETGTRPNSATDTDTLTRTVTYNVTKTSSSATVLAGTNFTYTVVAFNSGASDAPNVLFSDPLPAGVTFNSGTFTVNGTSTTGTVTFNTTTQRLEASLGTLLAGGTATTNHATITLNVTAAATANGALVNTATITGPDNTNGVASNTTVTVNPNFDLTVTKTDNATSVQVGQNLVYTIVVTNSGPSAATNVLVTDTLPTTQLTFVSATSTSGTFTNNAGVVSGTIATLASGASATVTVTATVRNDVPNGTTITNPVTVSATGENNVLTNAASDSTTVTTLRSISGFAYIDLDRDGVKGTNDPGIAGVLIFLTGTANGQTVSRQATTDATGAYTFADLVPGTYSITQTQPAGLVDSTETAGTAGGTAVNTAGSDQITAIPLNTANSTGNNFGETRILSKRMFMSSTTNATR